MAVLANANSSFTGSSGTAIYSRPIAKNNALATATQPTTHPAPQGGLVLVPLTGGPRG